MLWQVETVAQFGVVFLLFALGLEFSMAKVGIRWLSTITQIKPSCGLYDLSWIICCSCVNAVAESCRASCCPWRTSSNRLAYVSVWCHCLGMSKTITYVPVHIFLTIWNLSFKIDLFDICSCVEQDCQRVFLSVLSCLCHQLQWYLSCLSSLRILYLKKKKHSFPVSSPSFCLLPI